MGKTIVTGGAGFIGSKLACMLIEQGRDVIIIDNLSTGLRENIPEKCEFIKCDIRNSLPEKLSGVTCDTVFHLAAQSSGENSFYEPCLDVESNVAGTTRMLEFCQKNKIKRFLNMSSMSVYGEMDKELISEKDTPAPKSIYGATKLAAENICNILSSYYGINSTSFRLYSTYGAGQNMSNMKQGIVSIYLSYLLNEDKIVVKGALDRFRDLIYIDDVVECLLRCEKNEKTFGEMINLGFGKKTSVQEMLDFIRQSAGKTDFPVEVSGSTPGDCKGIIADISKLKELTGWQPEVSPEEGIKRMVQYYTGTENG